jgi:hypothetical protein
MRTNLPIGLLLGVALITLGACGGGGGDDEAQLRTDLEAAQEAAREAQLAAEAAKEAAEAAERKRQEEEEARKKAEEEARKVTEAETAQAEAEAAQAEAEAKAAEAERMAQQQIEQARQEAEQQANIAVRAPNLITEITAPVSAPAGVDDAGTDMGVAYERGGSRTFKRPLNLPAKGSAPSVPGGWGSKSYSGPRGTVGTDTVYLYTNIQAPGSKAFWKVHGEEVASPTPANATVSSFGTDRSLYQNAQGVAENRDNGSRSGTYDGYSGTFKCETGCNIAADANGDLTFTGTWTFTASLTAKRSSSQAKQDTEFLYFGIWAYEPTEAADAPDFKWAAGGDSNDGDAAIGNFAALTGEATFTGGAIGKYALARVGGRAAKIGTFTATASFTADFDDNEISGRITDFKEGSSDLGSDWHVFLGASASTAAGLDASGTTGTPTTHGAIDGDSATGSWAATLHGSDNPGASGLDRNDYPASQYPVADVAGVAGWFNAAAGTNAAIAGAFGAACTTGTMCAQ